MSCYNYQFNQSIDGKDRSNDDRWSSGIEDYYYFQLQIRSILNHMCCSYCQIVIINRLGDCFDIDMDSCIVYSFISSCNDRYSSKDHSNILCWFQLLLIHSNSIELILVMKWNV